MKDYIQKYLPFLDDGPASDDPQPVAGSVCSIVDLCTTPEDLVGKISDLNIALASYSQIEWVGTFDNLCNGDHKYAVKVREDFWEQLDDSKGKSICPEQYDQFKDYIGMYGV